MWGLWTPLSVCILLPEQGSSQFPSSAIASAFQPKGVGYVWLHVEEVINWDIVQASQTLLGILGPQPTYHWFLFEPKLKNSALTPTPMIFLVFKLGWMWSVQTTLFLGTRSETSGWSAFRPNPLTTWYTCQVLSRHGTPAGLSSHIPNCSLQGSDDCYVGDGYSYRGKVSKTINQHSCLYWNSHLLLKENYNMFMEDAEAHGIGEHNFCR